MTAGRFFSLLAWCAIALGPTPVHADVTTRAAQRYFEQGEQLFKLGRFSAALKEYQKAFDAEPLPELLYNIGQCYRNLGDYEHAVLNFRTYLNLLPNAPDKAEVETLIENLQDKIARGEGAGMGLGPNSAPAAPRPFYGRWWFWAGVSVAVVAVGGAALYASTRGGAPDTDLGNIAFRR